MGMGYNIDDKIQEAMRLHEQGRLLEAKTICEHVIALNPNHFDALLLLGSASCQLGQFDQAVDLLLKAVAINDELAVVHKNLGNAFEGLNRLDAAIASYDRAIRLSPAYAAAYNDRGNALKKLNRLGDAIVSYNNAITLKQDYIAAYNNLGVVLNDAKRHAEALESFEKAIRLKSDFGPAHQNFNVAIADLAQWNLLIRYRDVFGVFPRLHPPVSFNEHILHRIIYDRDPRLRILCDKLAVRHLIEERVGKQYVVPLLGLWERPRDIAWHNLPEKFVLKPNHASGYFAIVDRSAGVNTEELTTKAEQWLSFDYFDRSLEWGYRGLPRRVLAEPFLHSPDGNAAPEAQVHTFSGKAALINILVGAKRTSKRRACWFDVTGRQVAIKRKISYAKFQLSDRDRLEMVESSERVSQGFSSLRVDFYIAIDGLKIGELTPYTYSGLGPWDPPDLDEKLGQLWNPNCNLSIIPEYK
jgi:tetratricopeptide (TPR) repeat protein